MKKYLAKFIRDDEGMELIQVAMIIALAAIVGSGIYVLVGKATKTLVDAGNLIDGIDINIATAAPTGP